MEETKEEFIQIHLWKQCKDKSGNLHTKDRRGWVKYDSVDNLLPQRLLDLKNNSPILNSIINKKSYYTSATDIEFSNIGAKEKSLTLNNNEGLHEIVYKLILDYYTFGGFCIQIVQGKYDNAIKDISYQDFSSVRLGFNKDNEEVVYISNDWSLISLSQFKPVEYPLYKEEWNNEKPQYLYFRNFRQGGEVFYPRPDWWSARESVLTEINLIIFKSSMAKNAFTPNGILKIPGNINKTQFDKFEKEFYADQAGPENAGKTLLIAGDGDKSIEYISLSNNPYSRSVIEWLNEARQDIIMSTNLSSPTLIGLPGGASIGGDGGTIEASKQEFFDNTIKPVQSKILKIFKDIFLKMGFETEISFLQNYINATTPIATEVKQEAFRLTNDISLEQENRMINTLKKYIDSNVKDY